MACDLLIALRSRLLKWLGSGDFALVLDDLGCELALRARAFQLLGVLVELLVVLPRARVLHFRGLSPIEVRLRGSLRGVRPLLLGCRTVAREAASQARLAHHRDIGFGGALVLHELVFALRGRASGRCVLVRVFIFILLSVHCGDLLLVFLNKVSTVRSAALSTGQEASALAAAAAWRILRAVLPRGLQ